MADLGHAVRTREAAEVSRQTAEREREAGELRAQAIRREEAARLDKGELRAADLLHAQAWEQRECSETVGLAQAVERAARHLESSRLAEATARAALARAKADLEVVVKDQARFDDEALRDREGREQEAADEVFRAKGKTS